MKILLFLSVIDLLPEPAILAACCVIVGLAAYIQVSVGMGFGTISAPLIASLDPSLVPVTIMLMGLVVSTAGAWRERGNISHHEVTLGVIGRIIGMVLAIGVLLVLPDRKTFALLFGLLVLFGVVLTASGWRFAFTDPNLLGLSIMSGLMGTITSVGAPPMALIYAGKPPHIVRPTLNAFFGIGCSISLFGLWLSDWIHLREIVLAFVLLFPLAGGILVARRFTIEKSSMLTNLLLAITALAAIGLIIRGLI